MMDKGDERVVHIFPQEYHHGDAVIIGNRKGLLNLKEAIEKALNSGAGDCILMPSDAENYRCKVYMNEEDWESPFWSRMELPYAKLLSNHPDNFGPDVYGYYGTFKTEDIPRIEKSIEEDTNLD